MPGVLEMPLLLPVLEHKTQQAYELFELVWWPLQFAAAIVHSINDTVCAENWPCSQPGSRAINYTLWSSPNWANRNKIICHWASDQMLRRWSNLWKSEHIIPHHTEHTRAGKALASIAISISAWNLIRYHEGKHSSSTVREGQRSPFPNPPAIPPPYLSEPARAA